MKYIDADRLKVEIEKHIKEVKDAAERFTPNIGFFDAKLSGIYDVMAIVDSLQQEQPHWKPSEEHLKYLLMLADYFGSEGGTSNAKTLRKLHDNLKKLM